MFIEVTMDGHKTIVNLNKIEGVTTDMNDKTVILLPQYSEEANLFVVDESYQEVKALIEKEVAAGRGY